MDELDSDHVLLSELAHEFVSRRRLGEQLDVGEFAKAYPALASEIESLFPSMIALERFDAASKDSSACLGRFNQTESSIPLQLGDYRLLRKIGQGGMGIVYEAVQETLGRHVALKVLPKGYASSKHLERFTREARAVAQLHHTNIVPVFGCGEDNGVHFYAMQLIVGKSLDHFLSYYARRRQPCGVRPAKAKRCLRQEQAPTRSFVPPMGTCDLSESERTCFERLLGESPSEYYRNVARMGSHIAEALARAHASGVLHRDIKPSNLLLDASGSVWIVDFGLAQIDGADDLTLAHELIGTLRYVPPERFSGQDDARGDIYGLGLTLYEMLARRPAFQSASRIELTHQILHDPPPTLRQIDSEIPRDLETMVHKAMAREPRDRYQTAEAFGDDLARFSNNRPILARRHSLLEQASRWSRNNRKLAVVGTLALLMLVATAVVSIAAYDRESRLRTSLQSAMERAQSAERTAQHELYDSYIAAAKAARLSHQNGQRYQSLASIRQAVGLLPVLNLTVDQQTVRRQELRDLAVSCLSLPDVRQIASVPDTAIVDNYRLDRYVIREPSGDLVVRAFSGDELARLKDAHASLSAHFKPDQDDALVLVDGRSHRLLSWRFGEAEPTAIAQLSDHAGAATTLEFSPQADRLLLSTRGAPHGMWEIVDWSSGKLIFSRSTGAAGKGLDEGPSARLSPNGQAIAFVDGIYGSPEACFIHVMDVDSDRTTAVIEREHSVDSVAWHPDGQTLVVSMVDSNDIELWNIPHQRQVGLIADQRGGGPKISINTTGDLLSSYASWSQETMIWHPYASHAIIDSLPSRLDFRQQVLDGRLMALTDNSSDHRRDVWVAEPSPVLKTLRRNPIHGKAEAWRDVSIHPGGRLLAVGSDRGVSLFDLETGQDVGLVPAGYAIFPYFIPESGDLLTYSDQGLLRWPVRVSTQSADAIQVGLPQRLPCKATSGTQVACDASGKVIAVASYKQVFILHNFGETVQTLDGFKDCRFISVSPDGRWIATGEHDAGSVDLWDASSGAHARCFGQQVSERMVKFSPDGRHLAFSESSPKLWRVADWQPESLPLCAKPHAACFSFAEHLMLSHSLPNVNLYDALQGKKLCALATPHSVQIWFFTFTPDGTHAILNCNANLETYVWDLVAIREQLALLDLDWDSPAAMRGRPAQPIKPLIVDIIAETEEDLLLPTNLE